MNITNTPANSPVEILTRVLTSINPNGSAFTVYWCDSSAAPELSEGRIVSVRTEADLTIISSAQENSILCIPAELGVIEKWLPRFSGFRLLLTSQPDAALKQMIESWGYEADLHHAQVFNLTRPSVWFGKASSLSSGMPELLSALKEMIKRPLSVDEALAVSAVAQNQGETQLKEDALLKAVSLDRNNATALLELAADANERQDYVATSIFLEEAARAIDLPPEVNELRDQLFGELRKQTDMLSIYEILGRIPPLPSLIPYKILLITNLFPPDELGGYGRMMWEFVRGLRRRGHEVRVLTTNSTEFRKEPTNDEQEMESCVSRTLKLLGTWSDGAATPIKEQTELFTRVRDNLSRVDTTIRKFKPSVVIAGNIDLLTETIFQPAIDAGIPVLHSIANARPGYLAERQPTSDLYWAAPCSNWNGDSLHESGFTPAHMVTIYPGARTDHFFRFFLPDNERLRICYASLVMPYKGAQVLVDALIALNNLGVDFTAEIAGDCPKKEFIDSLIEQVRDAGLEKRVSFTGFLDRHALSALFARSNVLVFPSQFPEPFGISQVEAMASGLVVVSSGTGGAAEVVEDDLNGLLFDRANAMDLAEKLRSLAQDPSRMARIQKEGQAKARALSVGESVVKIEDAITQMLAKPEGDQSWPSFLS